MMTTLIGQPFAERQTDRENQLDNSASYSQVVACMTLGVLNRTIKTVDVAAA